MKIEEKCSVTKSCQQDGDITKNPGQTKTNSSSANAGLEATITLMAEGTKKPFIKGTTNLPNGTTLLANVWRDDPPYGWRNYVTVKNGKFRLGPLHKKSPYKGGMSYQKWWPFNPGLYNVQIGFSPVGQPKTVLAIVGENGSNISGPLVNEIVDMRGVDYKTTLELGVKASSSVPEQIKGNKEIINPSYSIHVGAYAEEKNAESLAVKLQAKGIDAFYFKRDNGVYAVRFGNYPTRDAAREAAKRLVADKVIGSYFIASPNTRPKETNSKQLTETEDSKLAREAKRIANIIRSQQVSVKFYSECSVSHTPVPHIICNMFFPTALGNMRYVHEIEAFTLDLATSFARDYSVSFEIYAIMKDRGDKAAAIKVKQSQVKGDFIPVCAYAYWKEFDRLESIWPSL